MIKVAIVDDQPLIRAGLRMILESESDLLVTGEAEDGNEAIALVQDDLPNVLLMDVEMPNLDGISATRHIVSEFPVCRIVMLTTFERDDYIANALQAGASGFLLKTAGPEELVRAIRIVANGESLLSPAITMRVIQQLTTATPPVPAPAILEQLTSREIEVLELLAEGLSNSELAAQLFVSEATIKTHISNLLSKLDLRDRVQAIVFAYRNGIASSSAATKNDS